MRHGPASGNPRPVGTAGFRPSPAQAVAVGFAVLILGGTLLLGTPLAAAPGTAPVDPLPAFFTATSAVTLTGLSVVDVGSRYGILGQGIVMALIQLGGFGIMSLTSMAGMMLTGRIGLRSRLNARAENRALNTGDIRRTLLATWWITVCCEATVAVIAAARLMLEYRMAPAAAAWEGIFDAVSAFNNAGFGLRPDSLAGFRGDGWIVLPLAAAFIVGGLGFPVIAELRDRLAHRLRHRRGLPRRWTMTTTMTLWGTALLIGCGVVAVACLEWHGALAGLGPGERALAVFFQGVTPRTAGFSTLDYGDFHPTTLMVTDLLMVVGGGSAGTAGGLKITTMVVLFAAIVAEVTGNRRVTLGHRSLGIPVVRQALAVAVIGITCVILAIGALRIIEPGFTGDEITFEAVSAFSTTGLSTGITDRLGAPAQLLLCLLMYLGRIGPVTLVTALARTRGERRLEYPEERPFIG